MVQPLGVIGTLPEVKLKDIKNPATHHGVFYVPVIVFGQ